MSFKNIFMIMMILIIALGVSAVSAEDLTADNDMITIEEGSVAAISLDETAADYAPQKIDGNSSANIVAENTTFYTGNDKKYSVTLLDNGTPLAKQNITFTIGSEFKSNSITDGKGVAVLDLTFLKAGKYDIQVQWGSVVAKATITVKDTVIGKDITKYYKNDTQYTATLYDDAGKPLSGVKAQVTINKQTYNRTTNATGGIKFNINLPAGVYTILVKNPVTNEVINNTVTVLPTLKGENIVKYFKNGTQYVITAFDGQGKPLAGEKLSININGQLYNRTTQSNGKATFDINLPAGKYTVTVTNKGNNEIISNEVTVLPTLQVENVQKYFKNDTQYVITALDGQGKPLAGVKLKININGIVYNRTTQSNGKAIFSINLGPGTYTVTVNSVDNNEFASSKVTVLSTVSVKSFSKYFKNGTQYMITTLDGQGKPIGGQKLKINVNGIFYDRTTNASGVATFDINLPPGKYTVTVNNTANGALASSTVTVLSALSVKDVTKYYKDSTQYYITALNGTGKPLAGAKLSINVNGQLYNRTTNASGIAKFDINLPVGEYNVTVTNIKTGEIATSKVTVLPNLFVKDVTKYYKNGTQYYITAYDAADTPCVNAVIDITVNNITYQRKTNASGVAKFDINLQPGKYKVNVTNTANGNKASSTVTVLPTIIADKFSKYEGNDTPYTFKTLDGQGKPLGNVELSLNINGNIYKRTTNENGTSKININLPVGVYTITITNPKTGEVVSATITILSHIVGVNTKVTYNSGGKFTFKVVDSQGKGLANKTATITINGGTYQRTTNENGSASMTINMPVGVYRCTVKADGYTQDFNITVNKRSLTVTIMSSTVVRGQYYKTKLADGKTPVEGVLVYYVYDYGKSSQRVFGNYTTKDGIAQLIVDLNPGTYSFLIGVQDNPIYANVFLTSTLTVKP